MLVAMAAALFSYSIKQFRMAGTPVPGNRPATAGVLFFISPSHIRLLVDDPMGVQMVVAGVTLQVIGIFWIRRILRVEY